MRLPAQGPGSCQEGWSPSTESGLQACYGESPGNGAFSIRSCCSELAGRARRSPGPREVTCEARCACHRSRSTGRRIECWNARRDGRIVGCRSLVGAATAASAPGRRTRLTLPGQQDRPPRGLVASSDLRGPGHRAGAGLPGTRGDVGLAQRRARHPVRRPLAGPEGVLVHRPELSRSRAHPRQAARRPRLARLQRHAGPEGRAADRAVHHRVVVRGNLAIREESRPPFAH